MYEVVAVGEGGSVENKESTPLLQYTIFTLNGLEIVNTRKMTSSPFRVPLSDAIPGFAMGLVGMRVGERRKLFIHPDLGYGIQGHVPPNSLLIAEVEVVGL
jgi:peptidylprolyl isomerase